MSTIDETTATSSSTDRSDLYCPHMHFSVDCSTFLNWSEDQPETVDEMADIFQSLVATVKCQPTLDDALEAKAVKFLEYVTPFGQSRVDSFLGSFESFFDDSSTNFVYSIVVLLTSVSQVVTTTTMKMLKNLMLMCSATLKYTLLKADLIPQLVITLNPLSLSLTDQAYIHTYLIHIIEISFWLATPDIFTYLEIEDRNEQKTIHETVLKQVLVPSEKYIWHLCMNSFSIIDGEQSTEFMVLLAQLLDISPSYQQTMDFVLRMPVAFTIPSCLTFFEDDDSIQNFLFLMINAQREWNETRSFKRHMWKTVHRMLQMEGIEDVGEAKLRNDINTDFGGDISERLGFSLATLPLPSASPSPPTPSHSPLPLPHHPHPPTPLCLSLTTHTLPLPSASPSPPTPSHSPLPLPHHPHPPLCLSLTMLVNDLDMDGLERDIVNDPIVAHVHKAAERSMFVSSTDRTLMDTGGQSIGCVKLVSNTLLEYCSPFLIWSEDQPETVDEKAVVFQSLVATVKYQPAFDASLEAKAVKFLESVNQDDEESADPLFTSLERTTDDSSSGFVQSIVVLISSTNCVIKTAAMKMFRNLIWRCSAGVLYTLVKAALIPQLITFLNLLSLSFVEAEDIHTCLFLSICKSLWLATPDGLRQLRIEDDKKQQTIHETVLKQVLLPSEKYICHLCMIRFSIVNGDQSWNFLDLLAHLLELFRYHQPTMEFVLRMPLFFTIPSCLSFFEDDRSIWYFLYLMNSTQWEWNKKGGDVRQIWKKVLRMLRMEGIEDVIEEKLQNDKNELRGGLIVDYSIKWSNLLGLNLPKEE
ncbi:hypothetical protein BLNAU_5353 [Blattamonas nauphoetae]|uniref:Uncharacterized protein n=1 Tax=Blattamonas nauphoetae TaxID=2049346 RepID=A0ABQ9Y729_9EUKA|nr:hypothetical protein BLNAU_5353 [Blattamonas nauphoetae]